MNVRSVLACAAAGIALLAFGATNAAADSLSTESLEATPGTVRAGDTVTLSGTCDYPGFTVPAPTESGALVPTQLTGTKDAAGVWHVTGTTTVRAHVTPGNWSVLFECAPGDVAVAPLTVVAGKQAAPQATPQITPQITPHATSQATEKVAVRATQQPVRQVAKEPAKEQVAVGSKRAAEVAAPAESTVNAYLLGVGAAALLAAGGLGVWAYRKRAR